MGSECQKQGHPCQESQPCQDRVTRTLEEMGNSTCKGTEVGMNPAMWSEILLQVVRKCLPWGLPWGPKPFTSFPHPSWPGIGARA